MRLFVLLAVGLFFFCCASATTFTYYGQRASSPPLGSCRTYTVRNGDLCWQIAETHQISEEDLEKWNPGINCRNLQIGQVLCVSDPAAPPAPPPPSGRCVQYAVNYGDTCYSISQAYGISLTDFENWNPDINCYNLQIGQLVCVSEPGSVPPAPPPPPAQDNGNIFREYIGAVYNNVQFSHVPINTDVSFHFILAFAIDYNTSTTTGAVQPSDGIFDIYWDNTLTADAVTAIKAQHSNVKVMLSLGGDSIYGQDVEFTPTTVESWVSNAVNSLTTLIQQYNLDGIDINYEHFASSATPETFATCIGQLITRLRASGLISLTSIAPFDSIKKYYVQLWNDHSALIDYVNFQFYTYSAETTADEYANLYKEAAAIYGGGKKLLASFNTYASTGPRPSTVLEACHQLQSIGRLPGIFVWSADNSFTSDVHFAYETQAQALLAEQQQKEALYLAA